jgi:hypothetical protein
MATRALRRAQKQIILLEPGETVLSIAIEQWNRLDGSKIANQDHRMKQLKWAIHELGLKGWPEHNERTTLRRLIHIPEGHNKYVPPPAPQKLWYAKALVSNIKWEIDLYQLDQWDSVLEVRNRLLRATLMTSIVSYVFLFFVLMLLTTASDPTNTDARGRLTEEEQIVLAGGIYFLVGAVIGGLFTRLRTAIESEPDIESVNDYGLSLSRLIAAPLFSGLAAVFGVAMFVIPFGVGEEAGYAAVFDYTKRQILVFAAAFGLTPAYLVERLGNAKEQLENIQSTFSTAEKGERAPAAGPLYRA